MSVMCGMKDCTKNDWGECVATERRKTKCPYNALIARIEEMEGENRKVKAHRDVYRATLIETEALSEELKRKNNRLSTALNLSIAENKTLAKRIEKLGKTLGKAKVAIEALQDVVAAQGKEKK